VRTHLRTLLLFATCALALSALCAQVEHNVRSPQPGDIGKLLDAMQAEMQRVASAVQTMLRT